MPRTIWCMTAWTCTENSLEVFLSQTQHITHQWLNQGSPDIFHSSLSQAPVCLTAVAQQVVFSLFLLTCPSCSTPETQTWDHHLSSFLHFRTLFLFLIDNNCLQKNDRKLQVPVQHLPEFWDVLGGWLLPSFGVNLTSVVEARWSAGPSAAQQKGPGCAVCSAGLPKKRTGYQEALLILVEMLAFLFSQCCQWLAAGGVLMPGTVWNHWVTLPMWHKPLGKLEARKQNDFQVIIGGNGWPCCLLLSVDYCAFLWLTCGQRHIWKGWTCWVCSWCSVPRFMLLGNICWQQGRMEEMPMLDFYT